MLFTLPKASLLFLFILVHEVRYARLYSQSLPNSFLFFLFIFLSPNTSFQFPLPTPLLVLPTYLLCKINCSSVFLQKRASLPGISTDYGIKSYNKTRRIPSLQVWTRQPSRIKRVPKERKRFRDPPTHTLPLL